ncbi:MAG: Mu transposase C-terminal domain-containing protein [Clostridiales bacterium]|jgi:hypothetical protein|nr:Mu transposase C-terminal domain-containing protein [Clostridiales bacterium]
MSADRQYTYLFDITSMSMPVSLPYGELKQRIENGYFSVQADDPYVIPITEESLSSKERMVRDNIWSFMKGVVTNEPDIYLKKHRGTIMATVMSETGKDLKNLHRYLKIYWQRGKTKNAFIPDYRSRGGKGQDHTASERKRGRPPKYGGVGINIDDATKAIFEKAIRKYYHNREGHTLQYAYERMLAEHYVKYVPQEDGKLKAELISEDEYPTIRQFRYWYNKKHGTKEKIISRKGEAKFNLDYRAVTGKADHGLMGPGARYEIDATIGDIYLVSRFNRADIIGRPVLYFVLDAFSRMVAGMYVGLEGPSWPGIMMAIANAMSDKVKYCAEYGIEITEDEWPCRGAPSMIRGDRGELESKAADTLVNALNVRVENAPPYRADMKGIVEQHFNTIDGIGIAPLPGHFKPDMSERGGRDYRLDAKLDIHQLTEILIRSVLTHNNHHLLESYERTEGMIADGVVPIPLELWNWGISHLSGALRVFPEDTVKLALMPADTASVTAKGIRFKNMYYLCERAASEQWFEKARAKGSWKVNISYDPRNMSTIYVREPDGTVDMCWLSGWQEKYVGKCLYEINHLRETEKAMQRGNAPKEMASKAELSAAIDGIIAEAEEMSRQTVVPKSKVERIGNIRENRRREKESRRQTEAFTLAEDESPQPEPVQPESPDDSEPISPTLAMLKQMLEERLNEQ